MPEAKRTAFPVLNTDLLLRGPAISLIFRPSGNHSWDCAAYLHVVLGVPCICWVDSIQCKLDWGDIWGGDEAEGKKRLRT